MTAPSDPSPTVDQALRELAGIVLGSTSLDVVLERATGAAQRAIHGADEVSVTLQRSEGPATVAASGALAVEADERQYDVGAGPCLEAVHTGETVLVGDVETDGRWPRYASAAARAGVRSSLSVPLRVDGESVGAMNAYSRQPDTFAGEAVRQFAESLADYFGVALSNAVLYFSAVSRADQLTESMRSRAVIEQAKGVVMSRRRCGPDEAFDVLVRLSHAEERKLRDVAEMVVREAVEG